MVEVLLQGQGVEGGRIYSSERPRRPSPRDFLKWSPRTPHVGVAAVSVPSAEITCKAVVSPPGRQTFSI